MTPLTNSTSRIATQTSHRSQWSRWGIVLAATVVHTLHSTCVYVAPGTLLAPIRNSLSLSLSQITFPLTVYRMLQAVFLLPAGMLLDTLGPHRPLRYAVCSAVALAPLLPLARNLSELVVLHALFSLTMLFGGLSAMLLIIDRAYGDKAVAGATAVLLSGYSLAGFISPIVLGVFAKGVGWRDTYWLLSTLFAGVAVPLVFLVLGDPDDETPRNAVWQQVRGVVRELIRYKVRWSRKKGTTVTDPLIPSQSDCTNSSTAETETATWDSESSYWESEEDLLPLGFAIVLLGIAAFSFSTHIMSDHLLLMLTEDLGMTFDTATWYISLLNLMAFIAKLSTGLVVDRVNKSALLSAFGALGVFGSMMFLRRDGDVLQVRSDEAHLLAGVVIYGMAYSGVFSVCTGMLREFGRGKLALRCNINLMVMFAAGSMGSFFAGESRAHTGAYVGAMRASVVCWVLVLLAGVAKGTLVDSGWCDRAVCAARDDNDRV